MLERLSLRCLVISLGLPLAACVPDVTPAETGGEPIGGTEGLDYLGGRSFSVSPDGRWLLYARDTVEAPPEWDDTPLEIARRALEAYVVLDLERRLHKRLGLGESALAYLERDPGVLHWSGCWIASHEGWYGALQWAIDGVLGFQPESESPRWEVLPSDREVVRERCRMEERWIPEPVRIGSFWIVEPQGDRVRIVDAEQPEQTLAEHAAPPLFGRVALSDPRLSPDGRRLSYVVNVELFGFAHASPGYVLDHAGSGPYLLGKRIGRAHWAPDGESLFASARASSDRANTVFRWRMPLRTP